MHIHILGICGTFMGGIAQLARAVGHQVSGSDANVYPPMSTQLEHAGIHLQEGFSAAHLQPAPDKIVAHGFIESNQLLAKNSGLDDLEFGGESAANRDPITQNIH